MVDNEFENKLDHNSSDEDNEVSVNSLQTSISNNASAVRDRYDRGYSQVMLVLNSKHDRQLRLRNKS